MTPEDTTRLRAACENTARAQRNFRAADSAGSGHVAAAGVLMEACADLSTHVPVILDLLNEVDRLNEALGLAYPRALQAAASLVVHDVYGSDLEPGLADEIADGILDLSNEEIEAFAAQSEADHAAAEVAEHYVCPGCHVVDDEPCLPGCIDAEIEGERRTPFDGFSEFNADDEGDEPEEGGTR